MPTTKRSMPMTDAVEVLAFTDGAAKGNPGPGGWGAVVLLGGAAVRELGASGGATTNNRMEMSAALGVLEWLREAAPGTRAKITIATDSTYLMRGVSEWLFGWKKRGWKTRDGGDVANRDLWEKLDQAVMACGSVQWRYVPGHAGFPGNDRADEIASEFALGRAPKLYEGPFEGYGRDLTHLPPEGAPIKSVSRETKSRSKPGAHSYVSIVDGVLQKHATWTECERRVKGRAGARFRKTVSAADERELLREWGAALDDPASGR
jgi:ribonuclease HI